MLAGVSTRRAQRVAEPVGSELAATERSTSKSAVSRALVRGTRAALDELLARRLDDLELAVVMVDGIELAGATHVVALGITSDATKVPLSLREGSTENATVATALLADLVDRGLALHERQLFVLDGAKALRKGRPRRRRHAGAGAALRPSQAAQRGRPPARARAAVGARAAAPSLERSRPRQRACVAEGARRQAGRDALPRRRLAPGGP